MATKTEQADTIKVEDGRLVIDVAVDVKGQKSASGKSDVHFSTRGSVVLPNGMRLGVNLFS